MRRLTLVRHARAEAGQPGGTDFDRHLDRRGLVEAADLAYRLAAAGLLPDIVLASPAPRALDTAQILARELRLPAGRLEEEPVLYLADPDVILERVRRLPVAACHVLVVGHNPGISDCARHIARDAFLPELPTAGACSIALAATDWDSAPDAAPAEVFLEPARVAAS